jgi:photosystem II stability/assembly factor-like uncharacterized protein
VGGSLAKVRARAPESGRPSIEAGLRACLVVSNIGVGGNVAPGGIPIMLLRRFTLTIVIAACLAPAHAQLSAQLYNDMHWRMIGPFRGGRTVAAVGIPSQPGVFYIGANNGGVWKTNDFGRVWTPIFDDQPTGSIGAIAVAPSNPDILYVGSGEGLHRPDLSTGDGIYKSTDGGKSWQHLGLRDGQQIPMIKVDPANPDRLFVAVLGHPYGPNEERGIFRSTDGGMTFQKVLYRDENTGAIDVAFDPSNSQTVYAVLWQARQGPWENGYLTGPGSGLFKSTDGGMTWKHLTTGLPTPADGLGRIGIEVSQSDPRRLYATVDAPKLGGIYGSRDGGESWNLVNSDSRLWGRGDDFAEVRTDPRNPDVLYVADVVTWKSTDGGKTFGSFRGAPGGDDYHRIWVNPLDPKIILIASDQGAIVTVNGGETFSSWYNQPTAQFYHVNTDNAFPYRVCGGQQESGSACVQSRGDDGQITFREWHPAAVEEYGYAVPDPLDPEVVYGGRVTRYDRRTGQVHDISPKMRPAKGYRVLRTQPLMFSPVDPHILYFASNTLWKTANGGQSWTEISPDLTRKEWPVPPNVGVYASTPEAKVTQRGVIYSLAPSPLDINRIWAGTDDGLIHVTVDGGKQWTNVTPSQLVPWAKVSVMEPSHFDQLEAYAAINTIRLDDLRPHILRTRDGGKSWTEITAGIPNGGTINAVREDPKRKGLLFAGSELAVYVSFDDGDHWQSLRLNMPASSIRDLVIHEDDLVAATHGRGFWILDDIEPLRQASASSTGSVHLFKPERTYRFRWNKNPDTPLPQEEPAGQNPPAGAIIDYFVPASSSSAVPVSLDILDQAGLVIRHYASSDKAPEPHDEGQVPWYWIRRAQILSGAPGMHRFTWDLHYAPAPNAPLAYPIAAIYHNTEPVPTSPWVLPGSYRLRLTVGNESLTQTLEVVMDPRVKTPPAGLQQQFMLSKTVYEDIVAAEKALDQLKASKPQIHALLQRGGSVVVSQRLEAFAEASDALEGSTDLDFALADKDDEPKPPTAEKTLTALVEKLRALLDALQDADVAPTTQQGAAVAAAHRQFESLMKTWSTMKSHDLTRLNALLKESSLPTITIP